MKDYLIYIVLTGVVLVIAFFMLGKTHLKVNPLARYIMLQRFVADIRQQNRVDAEKFWEFRDFYSGGIAQFDISHGDEVYPFPIVKTDTISSHDELVMSDKKDEDTYTLSESPCEFRLRFTKPFAQMKQANGYYINFQVEVENAEAHVWKDETVIRKPWCDK